MQRNMKNKVAYRLADHDASSSDSDDYEEVEYSEVESDYEDLEDDVIRKVSVHNVTVTNAM